MTPIHSRFRRQTLDKQHADLVAKALKESGDRHLDEAKAIAKLPGDPYALRGIPMIGRGVGGTITGTHPEARACR